MTTSSTVEMDQETKADTRTREMLESVIRTHRERGLKGLVATTMNVVLGPARRGVGRIVTVRYVYKVDLDKAKPPPEGTGLSFEEADIATLERMYSTYESEMSPRRYERLRQVVLGPSSSCHVVRNTSGDYCGYCCLAFGREDHAGVFGKISGVDVHSNGYLFRDYTFKKHRCRGIHAFGICSRLTILRDKGYKTATTRVARGNVAAKRSYSRVGFERRLVEFHFHLLGRFPNSNFLALPLRSGGQECH